MALVIDVEDPRADDVRALIETHLEFASDNTPSAYSFALAVDGLVDPDVTFFGARLDGALVGIGALKELDSTHAEIKSMHVRQSQRGGGVGRAVLRHLLRAARERGYLRVSLETGTQDTFAPARALYASSGFAPCGPFGNYAASPYNTFMTLELELAE